jgi:hypothetical protein
MLAKLRPFGRIKPRRAKQPKHVARVAGMGCLVCSGPAEIHHVRTGNQARDDRRVVPLCAGHHRHNADAFHNLGSADLFHKVHGINLVQEAERQWDISVDEGLT